MFRCQESICYEEKTGVNTFVFKVEEQEPIASFRAAQVNGESKGKLNPCSLVRYCPLKSLHWKYCASKSPPGYLCKQM